MPKTKPPKPPADSDARGGALDRARQFAVSRGLPMPQVEGSTCAPAKKKPAAPARRKKPGTTR
jgi:hypothetical protein